MDPIYRLPPDWSISECTTPLSEVLDWSANFLGLPELWKLTAGSIKGEPVKVAVLDTGVDDAHPDLDGQILDVADFTGSRFGHKDLVAHGTHCAGAIAAKANDVGVRGVAYESRLLCAKVLGDNGAGNDQSIGQGMKWAFDHGARFFSLSLGGGRMSEWLHKLFAEIAQSGAFIFCAAGNDGGPVNYPAAWNEVVAVGAVDKDGNLTNFTSRGPELDILAPGFKVLSTIPGGKYGEMTGTSMATPLACGVGVLAYAAHASRSAPIGNVAEMITLLKRTSVPKGQYGLIDPRRLASEAEVKPDVPGPVAPIPVPGGIWVFVPGGKVA